MQANYEFCTAGWDEYITISNHERWWIYAGNGHMSSHYRRCGSWVGSLSTELTEELAANSSVLAAQRNATLPEVETLMPAEGEQLPEDLQGEENVSLPFEETRDGGEKTENIEKLLEELQVMAEEAEKEVPPVDQLPEEEGEKKKEEAPKEKRFLLPAIIDALVRGAIAWGSSAEDTSTGS
jgi:hypothetical protein